MGCYLGLAGVMWAAGRGDCAASCGLGVVEEREVRTDGWMRRERKILVVHVAIKLRI